MEVSPWQVLISWDQPQSKSFGQFPRKIHFMSSHPQCKENYFGYRFLLSIKSLFLDINRDLFYIFYKYFLILVHKSSSTKKWRDCVWTYGDNSVSLTARAHLKIRSWDERWKCAQSDRTLKRILPSEITVSGKYLSLARQAAWNKSAQLIYGFKQYQTCYISQ